MKTILRFFVICLILQQDPVQLSAQQTTFTKVFYDAAWGHAVQTNAIIRTTDHNYIVAGEKDNKALALKMDPSGSIIWSKSVGGISSAFNAVTETYDSCVVLAGHSLNGTTGPDSMFCVKMKLNGDTLWTRKIINGEILSIKQTYDNGFIMTGFGVSPSGSMVLVKLSGSGTLTWSKTFSGNDIYINAVAVDQTPDTGYVISGYVENYISYDMGMFLMKVTPSGTISWLKRQIINGLTSYDVKAIQGGLLCYFRTTDSGITVMKTDYSGMVVWCKSYTGFFNGSVNVFPQKIHPIDTTGYVFIASDYQQSSTMIKIDLNGNIRWSRNLFLANPDFVETEDSGYMIAGNGPLAGVILGETLNPLVGIIKTDSLGNSSECNVPYSITSADYTISLADIAFTSGIGGTAVSMSVPVTDAVISVESGCVPITGNIDKKIAEPDFITMFPDPSEGVFTVALYSAGNEEIKMIEIYNRLGERIYHFSGPEHFPLSIDISYVPDGIYYVKVVTEKRNYSQKLVVIH